MIAQSKHASHSHTAVEYCQQSITSKLLHAKGPKGHILMQKGMNCTRCLKCTRCLWCVSSQLQAGARGNDHAGTCHMYCKRNETHRGNLTTYGGTYILPRCSEANECKLNSEKDLAAQEAQATYLHGRTTGFMVFTAGKDQV